MVIVDVPVFALVGVPLKFPVEVLKLAQAGAPEILNSSGSPSGSEAVGVKLYRTRVPMD